MNSVFMCILDENSVWEKHEYGHAIHLVPMDGLYF